MVSRKTSASFLTFGALGIVFGDIGTSPLYALQALFGKQGQHLAISQTNVYGIISLIFWAITIVVSLKYIVFVMRADNHGEGGVLALTALVKNSTLKKQLKWSFILLGLIGVSLFYGDSVITPAISVLSAVEGATVVVPHISSLIVPFTIAILAGLFFIQKFGTSFIGRLFGPVMLIWFISIGLGGLFQVIGNPAILVALSPLTALHFISQHPLMAFLSMGAVILAITGVEALYADMGHFGRPAISRAWFFIVFPALTLCYLGQGALILHSDPQNNILVHLFPSFLHVPIVILSTFATLIASQAVISGAFSLTRQAIQLKFLPKMRVFHTSLKTEGQIYVPFLNFVMFVLVVVLVLVFGSSAKLANAYGIAVSGTLVIDTVLFIVAMRIKKGWRILPLALVFLLFVPLDLLFVSSNLQKILYGGLFPLLIGTAIYILITTWTKGERIIDAERLELEGSLNAFVEHVHSARPAIRRIPGAAIYIGHHEKFVPLALHDRLEELHELPDKVVIVTIAITNVAHVPEENRVVFDGLGLNDGISHVSLTYGYHDVINVPKILNNIHELSDELSIDVSKASYFISLSKVVLTKRRTMLRWRKALFMIMDRNSQSASDYYRLPIERTEEVAALIKL